MRLMPHCLAVRIPTCRTGLLQTPVSSECGSRLHSQDASLEHAPFRSVGGSTQGNGTAHRNRRMHSVFEAMQLHDYLATWLSGHDQ
jgi:hypothetical protein